MSQLATTIRLDLREDGAPHQLTAALWTSWAEAAAVTLERFHAPPPGRAITVDHAGTERGAWLTWASANDTMRGSHGNHVDATEMGAYAIAVAALHAVDGWRIVRRAQHATGADLLMVRTDDPEAFVKLEVSGMGAGVGAAGQSALKSRLKEKVAQVRKGDLDRPGIAAVIGFELARVLISPVQP